jgi:hypothetical protein
MKKFHLIYIVILFFVQGFPLAYSQNLSTQYPIIYEYYRRQQLLGNENSNVSFNVRPINPLKAFEKNNLFDLDSTVFSQYEFLIDDDKPQKGKVMVLPINFLNQYNSLYPFGGNDGIMIPNRGVQSVLSTGLLIDFYSFNLQIQPEFVYAQNKNFIGYPIEHQSSVLYYYEYLNRIDMPETFGRQPYLSVLLGQSSFRYNHKSFSLGVSTENLWWGPGRRSSLLMSNNAPGFLHVTLNTIKPVETAIGSFEGQLISGRLNNSNFLPPHSDYVFQNNPVYIPKRNTTRYLSGLTISYQPKWVKGLFFGYNSVNHMYEEDMGRFSDYLPIFNGEKGLNNLVNPTRDARQQLSSGFFRWMSQEGHFEFYGEYGTNGNSRRLKDFLITPEKNRAFTLGFTNLISLQKKDQYLQVGAEMTQSGQTIRQSIRNFDTWYLHDHVRHGYTNNGQVMGIGYGPAANVNWIELAWVKNYTKIGFEFERIVYNNDYYYFRYEQSRDFRNKYVDLVPALVTDFKIGNALLSANVKYVSTLNYKWFLVNDPQVYFVPGFDRNNLQINLGISYLLQ